MTSRNEDPAGGLPPRFSFVIVSFNTLPLTRAAIASIGRHAAAFPREVILVDNHSADGSAEALRREFPDVKIIAWEENRGFAAANNAGAKIARGDWLILMNSDAELFAETMPTLDDLLRRHPEMGVLGGQLLNLDGSLQSSVKLTERHFQFEERRQQEELVDVPAIVGAFMVIRRELWERLGGMDEGYFLYDEEADFCRRAKSAGAVLRWSPRFRVLHHQGASSPKTDLRAMVEFWISVHRSWRKQLPEPQSRRKIRAAGLRFLVRVVWYFLLSLLTGFLLRSQTGRLRKNFHLLKWHWHGCPVGWGLRPAAQAAGKNPS